MVHPIEIEILPSIMSENVVAMEHISNMVNRVYVASEKSLWAQETIRTTTEEMTSLTSAGEIAVALSIGEIVGCVRVRRIDQGTGDFGMLAVEAQYQGGGIGRKLIHFAELHCLKEGLHTMQLELLLPQEGAHPEKVILKDWYIRLGYVPVDTESVDAMFPKLAPKLAIPCVFVIFHKPLR